MDRNELAADEFAARARRIKVLIFDVNGVLTDGSIWPFPAPSSAATATAAHAARMESGGRPRHCLRRDD
jgi:3-deoxy-D-manno-octulosonate 8-phosphate phosphatase (KDO 8-P phosphatase)